jgi:DNA-binding transcriptional LysR family regulator
MATDPWNPLQNSHFSRDLAGVRGSMRKEKSSKLSSLHESLLPDFDLNLFTIFVQIYKDRKVSLAADNLDVSQPTVSAALGRLRRLLDDEVFIRTGIGMQPTSLADQIYLPVSRAIQSIQDTLRGKVLFEPPVVSAGTGHGRVEDIIEKMGIHRRLRLRVPHFVALADVLEQSNLVATVPEMFAIRSIKHFDLSYCPLPIELPAIEIALYWHSRFHRDPANKWLRNLITEKFCNENTAVIDASGTASANDTSSS